LPKYYIGPMKCPKCGLEILRQEKHCPNCGLELVKSPKVYFSYAGPTVRIAAFCFDLALLLLLAGIVFLKNLPLLWLAVLTIFAYKPLTETFAGATLGKKLLGIQVVDPQGKKISAKVASLRFIPFIPLLVVCAAGLLATVGRGPNNSFGFLCILSGLIVLADGASMFISKEKKALHDLAAGSMCVFGPGKKYDRKTVRLAIMPLAALLAVYAGTAAFIALDPLTRLKTLLPSPTTNSAAKPSAAAVQETAPVVYEDCRITGIMSQGANPSIVVGKDSYRVGETVCQAKITGISAGKATVQLGDTTTEVGVGGKIKD